MKINEILKEEIEKIKPSDKEIQEINEETKIIIGLISKNLKQARIKAEVFLGGSLAKNTIIKKKNPDIDIFIRFEKNKDIEKLENIVKKTKLKYLRIHGSRDYFRIKIKSILFEIVPVLKIKTQEKAENVTDLSYFHVEYVKKKIKSKPKLADEIRLAKAFTHAAKCYGAESYIKGFSGYALELLVIYYSGFLNFIKAISKMNGKTILDPEKKYKNKKDILLNLNEAKLESPIVFIDPTFRQRNALAALSNATFEKFKNYSARFIKFPSLKFFEEEKIEEKKFNFIVIAKTNKQEGDIAGSKLLKFQNFLSHELEKYFEIKSKNFEYDDNKQATLYFSTKKKNEIISAGPPVNKVENVLKFKSRHKNVFIKDNKVYAREKVAINEKEFLIEFKKKYKDVMKEMGIISLS